MLRSFGVIVFVAIVGATGLYFAKRPTVARGSVLAADIMQANPNVKSLDCETHVPIGITGSKFRCRAQFQSGIEANLVIVMDREQRISSVQDGPTESVPSIKKTSDPWGD